MLLRLVNQLGRSTAWLVVLKLDNALIDSGKLATAGMAASAIRIGMFFLLLASASSI